MELAVTLPVLLAVVFGSIEASNAIYLKQALAVGAYEAARAATSSGGTAGAAEQRFNEVMAARRISSAQFTIEPQIDENIRAGTEVTVTVTVPANANSSGPQWYFKDSILTTRVVMVRN